MRELFVPKAFNASSRAVIRQANHVLNEYRERGFVLTLRQLYYQFVQRGLIPNTMREYKKLGSIINDARLAGKIDWQMIEDRTRNLAELPRWDNPEAVIQAVARQYRTDIWDSQSVRPEVWIEKEALIGVIEPVCQEFRVPYFACKGYTSQSEQWRSGRRFRDHLLHGQRVLVLHLGDHDPSGLDMTRDNNDRLRMFSGALHADIEIRRIALNMDQVEELSLAPNPAKITDSRFNAYSNKHGDESWELDALDPTYIDDLIRADLEGIRDPEQWDRVVAEETEARRDMQRVADRWGDVTQLLIRPDYYG